MFCKKKNNPSQNEETENEDGIIRDAHDADGFYRHASTRKRIKCCEYCDSELESTRKSDLCEACEMERLQNNVQKGAAIAAAIGLAKVVIPKVAPYAKKVVSAAANAVKKNS